MTVLRRLTALGVVLAVAACGSQPVTPESPPSPMPVVKQTSLDVATLVDSMNAFGADLLNSPVLADQANLIVSPASVSILLQMVAAGAGGKTAQEMAQVLHLPDGAVVHAQEFLRALGTENLKVSNTAWAQEGLRIKPSYTDALRTQFSTKLNEADFNDFEAARTRINKTVADQTGGKITELFPAGSLDRSTRLVLTNAIYLLATWAREFKQDRTADAPFTRPDGSTVNVPMMHNDADQDDPGARLGYAEGPGYQAVTLPYKGGQLAFSVILPTGPVADVLRTKTITAILKDIEPAQVTLSLPRFTVKSQLNLTETLAGAGMPTAFTPAADFTGITTDEPLEVAGIYHSTFVKVDEHGTEAAAATGAGVRATSAMATHVVTVDRPFLFVITDTSTGAPLFLGKVSDPTAKD